MGPSPLLTTLLCSASQHGQLGVQHSLNVLVVLRSCRVARVVLVTARGSLLQILLSFFLRPRFMRFPYSFPRLFVHVPGRPDP